MMDIAKMVESLEDPDGQLTIDQVAATEFDTQFVRPNTPILNFGFTNSYHWLRFSVHNTLDEPALLEIAHASLPVANMYIPDPECTWKEVKAGYQLPLTEKYLPHHYQLFSLPKGNYPVYVKVLTNCHPLPVRIWSRTAYEVHTYEQRLVYGFYLGFMFFVILNNLFLFFSLRNFLYLFYAGVVVIYISYASTVLDGFILYFFPQLDMMFWYLMIPTVGIPVQMIYCLLFLESGKYVPRLTRFTWWLIGYFAVYGLVRFVWSTPTVLAVNTVHALISFFMMGYVGVSVGKKGNKMGYYYALAYFIYFLLVLTEATYIQTGMPRYFLGLSHVAWATFIEAFVLSYLLSKRFEWEKAEIERGRQAAQHELLEATREKERLVKVQNLVLEQRVAERTEQLEVANRELSLSLEAVEQERQKSDKLLLNILPAATARELKENGFAKPKIYDSVTVLFADFKDFTQFGEHISPERLVDDLNQYFMAFDKIIQDCRLEKIKTIGDAYMAAGGLPMPNSSHPIDAVQAALRMQTFIENWKQEQAAAGRIVWDVRIGIHTGQVISGVVGMHKFSYDIWGDTVNTAARMETCGEPGKVNISFSTFELVKDRFLCTPRGKVKVKGKGKMEMFWVDGEQAPSES